jgi:predicted N-acetyltransferase YhbS
MGGDDIAAGMRLCVAAGWNQLEDDWKVFIESPGSGGVLAEREGRATGSAAFVRYGCESGGTLAWIAMMLVDPAERGAGIGGQLLEAALANVKNAEYIGLDATPLGAPLYRRFGFMSHGAVVRMKATIAAARFSSTAGRARKMNASDLPEVLRRDRELFGADRGLLLKSLFERAPECAWLLTGDTGVRGYAFGRPGRLHYQLGPVVADDAGIAQELISRCFSEQDGRSFLIDAPSIDQAWLAWLTSSGFAEERSFERMYLHGHAHRGLERQYAITGPEFS